jgi:hypothetical protein
VEDRTLSSVSRVKGEGMKKKEDVFDVAWKQASYG